MSGSSEVQRGRIVLLLADGLPVSAVARRVGRELSLEVAVRHSALAQDSA